jgi:hypothetical protein
VKLINIDFNDIPMYSTGMFLYSDGQTDVVNLIGKFLLIFIPILVKGAFTDVNFVLYFFSGVNVMMGDVSSVHFASIFRFVVYRLMGFCTYSIS